MSETWPDAIDTEEYDDIGEGIYDSEDAEADNEEFGEESRSARRRRERQRQIVAERNRNRQLQQRRQRLAEQRQQRIAPRQGQAPAAEAGRRQATAPVRSLDLETSVRLDALRRAVEESNRRANRATWAAVAGTTVDQGLDSFSANVTNQYVRAGARFAPLLLLSPAKKRSGVEGLLTDPRLIGAASILGITLLHGFTGSAHTVTIDDPPSDELGMNGTFDATAKDRLGNALSNAKFEWNSDKPWCLNFRDKSKGAFTLGPDEFTKESVKITVTAGGVSTSMNVLVTKPATTTSTKTGTTTSTNAESATPEDASTAELKDSLTGALAALTALAAELTANLARENADSRQNAVAADVAGENADSRQEGEAGDGSDQG
jgi:hypothetical protein